MYLPIFVTLTRQTYSKPEGPVQNPNKPLFSKSDPEPVSSARSGTYSERNSPAPTGCLKNVGAVLMRRSRITSKAPRTHMQGLLDPNALFVIQGSTPEGSTKSCIIMGLLGTQGSELMGRSGRFSVWLGSLHSHLARTSPHCRVSVLV